jgi:hypothetical protein
MLNDVFALESGGGEVYEYRKPFTTVAFHKKYFIECILFYSGIIIIINLPKLPVMVGPERFSFVKIAWIV